MRPPTDQDLRRARDEFRSMLDLRTTKEAHWQRFFAENPYVFSMSLPVRLAPNEIVPLGRPGQQEPDFVFFSRDRSPIPTYGLIELKRPDSQIITVTRSNVAILSRDAETAIQQTRMYARARPEFLLNETLLILGQQPHLFVIMGMSAEFSRKLGSELYRNMIEENLPRNLRLVPYDSLLQTFESQLPPILHLLVPAVTRADEIASNAALRIARVEGNIGKLEDRLEQLYGVFRHKQSHIHELRIKLDRARSDDFRNKVQGWINEEEETVADIGRKISQIESWIEEERAKLRRWGRR